MCWTPPNALTGSGATGTRTRRRPTRRGRTMPKPFITLSVGLIWNCPARKAGEGNKHLSRSVWLNIASVATLATVIWLAWPFFGHDPVISAVPFQWRMKLGIAIALLVISVVSLALAIRAKPSQKELTPPTGRGE